MSFQNPAAFWWGLLAIPIVLLYLRRPTPRRESVATGSIWQQVLGEQRARTAWRRWRHGASLALQLLILATFVLALAGDCPNFRVGENGTVPFWAAASGAALLVAEWCLYQRRWIV
jgi:hypothetical protein